MNNSVIQKYIGLNKLADPNGIVIFGGNEDSNIPTGELRQAFSITPKVYNRSMNQLSLQNAIEIYDTCVSPLSPETLLIHIGNEDIEFFAENSSKFDDAYRELILHIQKSNPKCRISLVSLRNYNDNPLIAEINRHLKYIADSDQCEYSDIATKRVWNPLSTMDAASFVYSTGFVRPLKTKRPLYDLVKIFFCYQQ